MIFADGSVVANDIDVFATLVVFSKNIHFYLIDFDHFSSVFQLLLQGFVLLQQVGDYILTIFAVFSLHKNLSNLI